MKKRAWLAVRRAAGIEQAEAVAAADTPAQSWERGRLRDRLVSALARIRPRQREVVLLYDVEGYSHSEIAKRLGISEVMSRRHLSDARAVLRQLLAEDAPEGRS